MPINPHNPFKGLHYPGEVNVLCVRWYLRYPFSYGSGVRSSILLLTTGAPA